MVLKRLQAQHLHLVVALSFLHVYDRCGSNYIKRVSSAEILDPILEEIRTHKGDDTLCFLYEGEQVHGHQSPVDFAGESLPTSLLISVESGLDRVRDRFVEHCATYAENLPAGLYSRLLEYTSENRCVDKLCREKWMLDAIPALVLLTQELWVDIFGDKEVASETDLECLFRQCVTVMCLKALLTLTEEVSTSVPAEHVVAKVDKGDVFWAVGTRFVVPTGQVRVKAFFKGLTGFITLSGAKGTALCMERLPLSMSGKPMFSPASAALADDESEADGSSAAEDSEDEGGKKATACLDKPMGSGNIPPGPGNAESKS